jgi:hypothetical protein
MRTKVYAAIVELLSDGEWHPTEELRNVTTEPAAWVKVLSHDRHFEYDAQDARIRLLAAPSLASPS